MGDLRAKGRALVAEGARVSRRVTSHVFGTPAWVSESLSYGGCAYGVAGRPAGWNNSTTLPEGS